MRLPPSSSRSLQKRASGSQQTLVIVAAVVIGLLVLAIGFHFATRTLRIGAKWGVPSAKKKNGSIWSRLPWRRGPNRGEYSSSLQGDELSPSIQRTEGASASQAHEREMAGSNPNRQSTATTAGVDRNTSVRSIMTLPPYSAAARENEQILGREGERAGIDLVLELPETQDEEETRREEEMDSLYQIRVARRAEAAEREERRRLRREARARNDHQALAEIRRRAESTSDPRSATLIAQHQTTDRQRRVSSVQYAELGVARHDGTRVRANSGESDRRPLLESSASMAESRDTLSTGHGRGRSGSSVLSLSSNASDDDLTTQRTISQNSMNDYEVVSLNHSRTPSATRSTFELGSDMGVQPFPSIDPPVYDDLALGDAPPYESPIRTRAPQLPSSETSRLASETTGGPQLPAIERLPSIRVTNAQSDSASTDNTPRI